MSGSNGGGVADKNSATQSAQETQPPRKRRQHWSKRKRNRNGGPSHRGPKEGQDLHAGKIADSARPHAFEGDARQADTVRRDRVSSPPQKKQGDRGADKKPAHQSSQSFTRKNRQSNYANSTPRRAVYSAIDLGTNNCRLLIARPTPGGFRVVDAFSRIVRLGEGIAGSNKLSDDAMDRAVEALKICAEKIKRRGVTTMHHVATEACRIATNAPEFVERVRVETGINLKVISAAEEAELAVMGCQSLIAKSNQYALVFDIGGGSTELIWVRLKNGRPVKIEGWTSVPWGVVNLTEAFCNKGESVSQDAYHQMVAEVQGHMQKFEDNMQISGVLDKRKVQFLGTSGTVTTLASLHLELPKYDRSKVDGVWMKAREMRNLSNRVALMTPVERAAQACIGEDRADLVVAGCAILETILGTWKVNSVRVADRGIREGILRKLIQTDKPPQPRQGGAPSHDNGGKKDRQNKTDRGRYHSKGKNAGKNTGKNGGNRHKHKPSDHAASTPKNKVEISS